MIKRFLLAIAVFVLVPGASQAQVDPTQPEDSPSVAHAIPLTYIGSNGRVSMSIDNEGNSTGEALGVFDNTGEHAYIAQAWWGNGGAGGAQVGYNWLWGGLTLRQAKENPERVTVVRTMIAADPMKHP